MMNNEGRETVIVPEKKEKIERIKRKYQNMEMADDTAKKIKNLEVVNNILVAATGVVGILTVVNYFVPDPVPGIDEAVMTGATALLGSASTIVKNKINDLAATGTTEVKMEEVTKLSDQLSNVARKVAEKKNGQVKAQ
ncbi:MAG: hypothetical protein E7171_07790 [Firmicutes bacterium]|nr:hypothetical protein [Bacillota bacterium]